MWRYAMILSALAVMLVPTVSQAQFKDGDWELTLSGAGSNDQDFRTGSASINGSVGYFLSKELELSVRQGVVWGDGGSAWTGDSRFAVDYHIALNDRWVPFIGANIGYQYGDSIDDSWIAGPEAGVKFFLNSTTFVQVLASYEFDLNNGIDDGAFFYGLGIGVRL